MITGGCHAVDIARYLKGEEVEEVSAHRCKKRQEIDNLTESILYETPVLSDVLDACNSQEVALAIEESAGLGKPVRIQG